MANGERDTSPAKPPTDFVVPLVWAAVGGVIGSGAPPDGAPWLAGLLSAVAGVVVLWISASFRQERARRAGFGNPYRGDTDGWKRITGGAAFVLTFLSIGMLLTVFIGAAVGPSVPWLPVWSALLGIAAALIHEGYMLGNQRRAVPRTFVNFSYIFFILTCAGFVLFALFR